MTEGLRALSGHIGFYYENLLTGETETFHAEESFLAASVIKLPILAAISAMASRGECSFDEKLTVTKEDMFPSCGTLRMIAEDVSSLSVRSLCRLMITVSDNSATNLLIRRYGIDRLNREFRALGLPKTHIERFLFDSEASMRGLENRIIPKEIGGLLTRLYHRTLVTPEADEWMMSVLLDQQMNHKIPCFLPNGIRVAHKTGEDSGITNDVGIVFADVPFTVVFVCNECDTVLANMEIRTLSRTLTERNTLS